MRVPIERAAQALQRKADAIQQQVRDAEAQSARDLLRIARAQSSGPLSTAQLRMLGHPYARRRPRPPFSAAIINVQSGRFKAGWRVIGPSSSSGGIRSRLVNVSPEARWMTERGTSRMIGRPVMRAIAQRERGLRQRRLARAVRQGLET